MRIRLCILQLCGDNLLLYVIYVSTKISLCSLILTLYNEAFNIQYFTMTSTSTIFDF